MVVVAEVHVRGGMRVEVGERSLEQDASGAGTA